jgi:hypothetical protein
LNQAQGKLVLLVELDTDLRRQLVLAERTKRIEKHLKGFPVESCVLHFVCCLLTGCRMEKARPPGYGADDAGTSWTKIKTGIDGASHRPLVTRCN